MKGKTSTKKTTSTKKSSGAKNPSAGALTVNPQTTAEIRQIENGFVIRESWTKGTGPKQTWGSKEYFSQTNPLSASKGKISFTGKKK